MLWKPRDEIEIAEIAPRLHRISATTGKHRERQIHAYLLLGVCGNALFHGPDRASFYKQHADFFDGHGGIGLQVLTHQGDASKACAYVHDTWGAPIVANEWDADAARRATGLAVRGFKNDESLAPGVEGVHLPGHSVGFTAFRCALDGASYLISGHAIRQLPGGSWGAGVNPLMRDAALRSLRRLRDLEVDFLLPDRTRHAPPPLPFGPEERAHVTAQVHAYLVKRHGDPAP